MYSVRIKMFIYIYIYIIYRRLLLPKYNNLLVITLTVEWICSFYSKLGCSVVHNVCLIMYLFMAQITIAFLMDFLVYKQIICCLLTAASFTLDLNLTLQIVASLFH